MKALAFLLTLLTSTSAVTLAHRSVGVVRQSARMENSEISDLDYQQTGSIQGTITAQGSVVPGVEVTVRDPFMGVERTILTGDDGSFSMQGLRPGTYEVTVKRFGLVFKRLENVEVALFRTTTLDIDIGDVPISSEVTPAGGGGRGGGGRRVQTPEPDFQVSNQSFKDDVKLSEWLEERRRENKLLIAIVQQRDDASLFVLQRVSRGTSLSYTVVPINETLSAERIAVRINQNRQRTFAGIYRINPNSYVIVFYAR